MGYVEFIAYSLLTMLAAVMALAFVLAGVSFIAVILEFWRDRKNND